MNSSQPRVQKKVGSDLFLCHMEEVCSEKSIAALSMLFVELCVLSAIACFPSSWLDSNYSTANIRS